MNPFEKICESVEGRYVFEEYDKGYPREFCNFEDNLDKVDALTFVVEDDIVIGDIYANALNMVDWWQDGKHELIKTDEGTMHKWIDRYEGKLLVTGYRLKRPEGRKSFVVNYIRNTGDKPTEIFDNRSGLNFKRGEFEDDNF